MIEELKAIERETLDMAASLRGVADHLEVLASRMKVLAERNAADAGAVLEMADTLADVKTRLDRLETPKAKE